jgi:carbon-monoxide dehydrogenase small subunit
MRVDCTVNGEPRVADDVWEGESLLYVLRERLGLPGSKNACEQGECGSCSVYLDGTLVCACLVAAGQAQGAEVVTVEGLAGGGAAVEGVADGGPAAVEGVAGGGLAGEGLARGSPGAGRLHPVQAAFLEAGAVQCGFCTPGLLIATHDLLRRDPNPSDARIREALAGNLCRCTGYQKILDAVHLAATRLQASASDPSDPSDPSPSGPAPSGGRPAPCRPAPAFPPGTVEDRP